MNFKNHCYALFLNSKGFVICVHFLKHSICYCSHLINFYNVLNFNCACCRVIYIKITFLLRSNTVSELNFAHWKRKERQKAIFLTIIETRFDLVECLSTILKDSRTRFGKAVYLTKVCLCLFDKIFLSFLMLLA